MNQHVLFLQKFLNANGADLVEDGIFGSETSLAIEEINVPIWVKVALKEVGTLEVLGSKSNKRIEQYHLIAGLPWAKDEVPWCGSAMAFVFQKAIKQMPKEPARALSWSHFGIDAGHPIVGSVAVKERKGGGHVGIVLAVQGDSLLLIGGNQSDAFCIKKYRVSDFGWFRYPKGQQLPSAKLAYLDTDTNLKEV